jgi:hypothetical protein
MNFVLKNDKDFGQQVFRRVHKISERGNEFRDICLSVFLFLCLASCQSSCPSDRRIERLGSHRTDFNEISCLRIFRKFAQMFEVLLASDKNNRYFTEKLSHIYGTISLSYSWNEKY